MQIEHKRWMGIALKQKLVALFAKGQFKACAEKRRSSDGSEKTETKNDQCHKDNGGISEFGYVNAV